MKIKKALLLAILCCLGIKPVLSKEIISNKEVSNKEASFLHFQERPTTHQEKFDQLLNLVKEENFTAALRFAFNLLEEIDQSDVELRYKIEFEIGSIFSRTNSNKKSLDYFKKALRTLNSIQQTDQKKTDFIPSVNLINTYYQLGAQYFRLEKLDSLKVSYLDSAKFYFDKVENHPSLNDQILDIQGRTFTNLSGLYFRNEDYLLAEAYAKKAINIHKKRRNKLSQAGALNNLGNIYLVQDSLEIAKATYLQGINLINNDNSNKAIEFKADMYNNLAFTLRKMEDYTAYDELEKAYEFTDQVRDQEIKRIIEEITAEYNVDKVKKDAELDRRNFWIYVIISLLLIMVLGVSVWLYYQRKENLALELEKSEMIQKQKVEAVKSESQKRILNAVIEGKEKERKEIAETLHDSVSTLLSSANLHLQASAKQFNGEMPLEITKTKVIITEASAKIRDLSHDLMSAILIKFGLTYAIKDLTNKYSNSELHIEPHIDNIGRYTEKFEIKVYNIVQEFINNILKHSKASYAQVKMREVNKNIVINIKDNGVGFDMSLVDKKEGIGLKQIEARVQLMHGDFKIISGVNKGTEIEISIPAIEVENQVVNA